jgi:hypothetical protein
MFRKCTKTKEIDGEGGILAVVNLSKHWQNRVTLGHRINHLQDDAFQPLFSWLFEMLFRPILSIFTVILARLGQIVGPATITGQKRGSRKPPVGCLVASW